VSRLLIDEQPLEVLPGLACEVGLNEAMVRQQLHWIRKNPAMGKVIDGRKWVRMTYKEWRIGHFPFWSDATIQRIFESLEKQGLVNSRDDLNQLGFDRTKWYAIDDEAVDRAEKELENNLRAREHNEMIARHSKMRDGRSKVKNASSQDETTIPDASSPDTSSEQEWDSIPSASTAEVKDNGLMPILPEERHLFESLNVERSARRRSPLVRFKTTKQREKFRECVAAFNGSTNKQVDEIIANGKTDLEGVVNVLAWRFRNPQRPKPGIGRASPPPVVAGPLTDAERKRMVAEHMAARKANGMTVPGG
jgi:hypothetical protein